jgi:hypothetical protein
VDGSEGLVASNLKTQSLWVLSGTPPLGDFADIKMIARFMGINLGINDFTPGSVKQQHVKSSIKDLTGKFCVLM